MCALRGERSLRFPNKFTARTDRNCVQIFGRIPELECQCDIHAESSIYEKFKNGYPYVYEAWMSIRVFLGEWIFRHGYYHGHRMDTSTRVRHAEAIVLRKCW